MWFSRVKWFLQKKATEVRLRLRPFLSLVCLFLLIGSSSVCAQEAVSDTSSTSGHNVILIVGDGMGPAFVTAARVDSEGASGTLALDSLPRTALVRTYARDYIVTDSAAAATAMSCGEKTAVGILGMRADARERKGAGRDLENLTEWGARWGISVGVVTNTSVTNATPAAFYAHHTNREAEYEIAQQASKSSLVLLMGGGEQYFRRGVDLAGWTVFRSQPDLIKHKPWEVARVLGIFAEEHLPFELLETDREGAPTLLQMSAWALEFMEAKRRPYLLVIEGGRIDHAAHGNRAVAAIQEVLALDSVVNHVIGRVDESRTMVLVCADHETGGFALNGYPTHAEGIRGEAQWPGGVPVMSFATGPGVRPRMEDDTRPSVSQMGSALHTGTDIVLYAWGAGSGEVHGTLENTDIYRFIKTHLKKNVEGLE
ncbi:MAG: alkaline phosphatase [Candidatus Omnitrophica bacterium]|nr:alkaline phosphatase [Candidatus Omnitrophota bacterium]